LTADTRRPAAPEADQASLRRPRRSVVAEHSAEEDRLDRDGSAAQARPRSIAARIFAGAVVLVLAWHFLLTATWSAAPNAVREIIGQNVLTSYMVPLFQQGWAVFAPNPGASNVSFEVRALVPGASGADPTPTEWFSLTARDHEDAILNHAVPSRLYLNNYILGDRWHGSFLAMKADVRELVGKDYYGSDWLERIQADLLTGMKETSDPAVSTYIEYEQTATGLATAVARARWGDDIVGVQLRTITTPVVPFTQRLDPNAQVQTSTFTEGWREPLDVAGLDAATIDSLYGPGGDR
jgi:hypothetical protein